MDLSKMLNADEAGDRDKGAFERPRLARARSELVPHAHGFSEHNRAHEGFTSHDDTGHSNRPRPLPRLQTDSYSYNHQPHQNAYPQTANVNELPHSPHQQFSHTQISYPQTAPITKPPSPFTDRPQLFSRQSEHNHAPTSRQQSNVSGGSPPSHPLSPFLPNQTPTTPQKYGKVTPNKAVSLEHRTSSHASSASSHSHPAPGHSDSPLSTRSTSQSHLIQAPQQGMSHQFPHHSPHSKSAPTQYVLGYPPQHSPGPTPTQPQTSHTSGNSRPGLYNRQNSAQNNQDLQRPLDHSQSSFGQAFQPLYATPLSSTNQLSSQVLLSPSPYMQPAAGLSPQIVRVSGSMMSERERSISVSPKTIVATLPAKAPGYRDNSPSQAGFISSQMNPPSKTPLINSLSSQPIKSEVQEASLVSESEMPLNSSNQVVREKSRTMSEAGQAVKRRLEEDGTSELTVTPPPAKKPRFKEPPIWARNAKFTSPLPNKNSIPPPPRKQPTTLLQVGNGSGNTNSSQGSSVPTRSSPPVNGHSRPVLEPEYIGNGPLGPWEKNILNFEPQEEFTKAIGDFLFQRVVEMDDTINGGVGEGATFKGQLEIEAKIGTLVDKNTDERLRLPIQTEAILEESYNHVAFESTMTERQHRAFNDMLNDAVKQSLAPPSWIDRDKPPPRQRIPMGYVHTRETDSFYDLPKSDVLNIPSSVRQFLKPGQTLRLRVTTDQKTGNILAKIVKIRMFDLHVYSPRTPFDWRVSVSFEMEWEGDSAALAKVAQSTQPNRNKDRVSYKHLAYQIDLTQVKQSGAGLNVTHELEIEMAVPTLVAQGKAAQARAPNQYMDLVKTFANNVRTMIRHSGVVSG